MDRRAAIRADGRSIVLAGLPDGAIEDGALRWRHGAGFRLDGGGRVYVVDGGPLHYVDLSGNWAEYDLRFAAIAGLPDYCLRGADYNLIVGGRANAEALIHLERSGRDFVQLTPQALETHQSVAEGDPQIEPVGAPSDSLGQSIDQADDQLTRAGRLYYPDALGLGLDLELQPTERGLSKQVTLSSAPSLPGVIAGDATLRLRWLCNTNLSPHIKGQEWSGKPVTTTGPVELHDRNGQAVWHWPTPRAIDAAGDVCQGQLALSTARGPLLVEALFPLAWFRSAVYPVVLDPDTYYGTTNDGDIYGYDANYATARGSALGLSSGGVMVNVGQQLSGGNYYVTRGYVEFDTSGLAADHIVTKATLTMTGASDNSVTDFDVLIHMYDWAAPLAAGNMEANYDGALAAMADGVVWRNTSGLAINTPYASPALDTSWINPTGHTRYALLSGRDVAGTPPEGNEYVNIKTQENGPPAQRPHLIVYTAPKAALERIGFEDSRARGLELAAITQP